MKIIYGTCPYYDYADTGGHSAEDIREEAANAIAFQVCDDGNSVDAYVPTVSGDRTPDHVTIVVAASPFSTLESVVHAVLAPSFAPGYIGVDWEDVRGIVTSGKRAIVVMAEAGSAVPEAVKLAEAALGAHGTCRVSGIVATAFLPREDGALKETAHQLRRACDVLAPDAPGLYAVPVIVSATPICALLIVLS